MCLLYCSSVEQDNVSSFANLAKSGAKKPLTYFLYSIASNFGNAYGSGIFYVVGSGRTE